MQCYLLISVYNNGCDWFEKTISVFNDETVAELKVLELMEGETDSGQSYKVEEWDVE